MARHKTGSAGPGPAVDAVPVAAGQSASNPASRQTGEDQPSPLGGLALGLAGLQLINKLVSFGRELAIAAAFGATGATDIYATGYTINVIVATVLGTGTGMALVPLFSRWCGGPASGLLSRRRAFMRLMPALNVLALLLVLAALAGSFWTPTLVHLVTPGFDRQQARLAAYVVRLYVIAVPLVGLFYAASYLLNALEHFISPVLLPVLVDGGIIITTSVLGARFGVSLVAWTYLLGGVVVLAVVSWQLFRRGLTPLLYWRATRRWLRGRLIDPLFRQVLALALPLIGVQVAGQLYLLAEKVLGSSLAHGRISELHYALLVADVPQGLIALTLSTVLLPHLSQSARRGSGALASLFNEGLRLSLSLALPAAVGLLALAGPVITLLYQYGQFNALDSQATAAAMMAYAPGMLGAVVITVTQPVFYAYEDSLTPFAWAALATVMGVGLALWWLPSLGYLALPLGYSAGQLAAGLGLLLVLERRRGLVSAAPGWLGFSLKLVAGTAMLAVVVLAGSNWLHLAEHRLLVLPFIAAAAIVYISYAVIVDLTELKRFFFAVLSR